MEPDISKENPNKFQWKDKLEDVNSLSAETLTDKNSAWEKLYSRLRQEPRHRRAIWYWAAACILPVIIMLITTPDKREVDTAKNNAPKSITQKIIVSETLSSKENTMADISPSLTIKRAPLKQLMQITDNKDAVNIIAKKNETIPVNFDEQNYIKQKLAIPPAVINSRIETLLVIAPVKKKLKVVHINELDVTSEEIPNVARHFERRSFQVKLINSEVYTRSSLTLNNTGFNIFKTKNAPSN